MQMVQTLRAFLAGFENAGRPSNRLRKPHREVRKNTSPITDNLRRLRFTPARDQDNRAALSRSRLEIASMLSGLMPAAVSDLAPLRGVGQLSPWPTLLVVDSDEAMRSTLVCFFEKRGFHVAAAADLGEMKDYFHRRRDWTLIIADFHLPDGSGAELCDWVEDQGSSTPVLLLSGSPHAATLCAGHDYLEKPFPIAKLEAYVHGVQHRR